MAKKRQAPKPPVEEDEGLDIFDEWEEGDTGEPAEGGEAPADADELLPPEPPVKRVAKSPPRPAPSEPAEAPTTIDPLEVAPDVPVQIIAVLAKKNISMRELMEFHLGSVIDLNRPTTSTVDLVANGRLIARGDLVEIDGKLGVRITKIVK